MERRDFCLVAGCGDRQNGWPVCEYHWTLFFAGICAVERCENRTPWDHFACARHARSWQRGCTPPPVTETAGSGAAGTGALTVVVVVKAGSSGYSTGRGTLAGNLKVIDPPTTEKPTRPPTFVACSIEGCDQPLYSRGWCAKHYARWWRRQHRRENEDRMPLVAARRSVAVPAALPNAAQCAELIDHLAGGDLELRAYLEGLGPDGLSDLVDQLLTCKTGLRSPRACKVDGCDQPHRARGYCKTHYDHWSRHGDTSDIYFGGQRITNVCGAPDCWAPQRNGSRFCRNHLGEARDA